MPARQKLEQLLRRVQSRRAAPRLRVSAIAEVAAAIPAPLAPPPSLDPFSEKLTVPSLASDPFVAPSPVIERRPSLPTPLEDAMGQLSPPTPIPDAWSTKPPPQAKPAPVQAAAPTRAELDLLDFEEAAESTQIMESSPAAQGFMEDEPELGRQAPSEEPELEFETPLPTATRSSLPPLSQSESPALRISEPPAVRKSAAPAARAAEPEPTAVRIEAQPMARGEPPVSVVARARPVTTPSFGELIERSLALRPRR